jgi:hypothetical protein
VKLLVVLLIVLTSIDAHAECNQEAYDYVYASVVRRALHKLKKADSHKVKQIMDERNEAIEGLRFLCLGQRSSGEGQYWRTNGHTN